MRSSQASFDMIVREEVSSKETYIKKYQRPEWPGAASGPTVGIGYDLGQTPIDTIRGDWTGIVPAGMVEVMAGCSGFTGQSGKAKTAQVWSLIFVSWDDAITVHKTRVIPRWEAKLAAALPNTDKLSPDCFGVLLSLIFNRGTSFNLAGDRYREMRAIKAHMQDRNFHLIPAELRSMKRLWPDLKGLQARRDREAALFEKGLRAAAIPQPKPKVTTEAGTAGGVVIAGGAAAERAHASGLSLGKVALIVVATVVVAAIAFVLIKNLKKG